MIKKDEFVDAMTRLMKMEELIDDVDAALKKLSLDFGGFYISEAIMIPINILEKIFKDEEEWLSYFVFEKNWLHDFKRGDVVVDDVEVDLNSWEKVYDFLVANMDGDGNVLA